MATPNYNDPRAGSNAFSIGQQELLRLKNRIGFIEEAFDALDDDPTDAIPTKLSELQNDVGFITADDIPEGSGGTVPTKTSDLINDSGFVTSEDVPTKTSQLQNNSGFINSSGHISFIETWKSTDEGTYGAEYLIRAKWQGADLAMFECGDYRVGCQYADSVPWTGITGKPALMTETYVLNAINGLICGKNLYGGEFETLYPVYLPIGTIITVSTPDTLPAGMAPENCNIKMYNKNKVQMDAWSCFVYGATTRTIALNEGINDVVKYISISSTVDLRIQVEIGGTATAYESYVPFVLNQGG